MHFTTPLITSFPRIFSIRFQPSNSRTPPLKFTLVRSIYAYGWSYANLRLRISRPLLVFPLTQFAQATALVYSILFSVYVITYLTSPHRTLLESEEREACLNSNGAKFVRFMPQATLCLPKFYCLNLLN